MILTLGLLVREARDDTGYNRKETARRMALGYQTLQMIESGGLRTIPNKMTLRAIETYFGWRTGVLTDLWERRRTIDDGELSLEDVQQPPDQGVLEARHLTDEQLIHELTFRLIMKQSR